MTILFLIITYIILRQTPAKAFADRHVLRSLRKIENMLNSTLEKRGESRENSFISRYNRFWIARIEQAIRFTHPHLPSPNITKQIVEQLESVE
jgi:hypothetical protein